MKTIIMPGDFYDTRSPDSMFIEEYNSAKKFGNVFLFAHEEFLGNEILKKLPKAGVIGEEIYYHGWMMNTEQYRKFYYTLCDKGYRLTNSPREYFNHHHFDGWYNFIEGLTPKSVMINNTEVGVILDAVCALQKETQSALIIKDTVKSLKHDWFTACFIPENASPLEIVKVITTFLEIKKEHNDLKLPVVIRQFEQLVSIGKHPLSGTPVSHEYRTYVYKDRVILQAPYWDMVDYNLEQEPPKEFIQTLIDRLMINCPSELFTIDTALKQDGQWTCIEVGDGQVSSLPVKANKDEFFSKLLG